MKTEIIKLDINKLDTSKLSYAAQILRDGGMVAFPTETVYGLGAHALNETSVKNIYIAKGRPSDNPLIVHISKIEELKPLVLNIPDIVYKLSACFWPGPLTMVLQKSDIIPSVITGGLNTVAVRMPSHPIAAALIEAAGIPVAAPSANRSGRPSPTCAQHVIEDLVGRVDVIIDGGIVDVGLESTVLDLTCNPPVILRPGGVSPQQLEDVIGKVNVYTPHKAAANPESCNPSVPRSPGMKYRHYAPKAKVTVFDGQTDKIVKEISRQALLDMQNGINSVILATDETVNLYDSSLSASSINIVSMGSRKNPETIAHNLFMLFREQDQADTQHILAEGITPEGVGLAVMNRLVKAAGNNVVEV